MRPLTILIIGLFIIIKPIAVCGLSEREARDILGNNFISAAEAAKVWNKTDTTGYEINNFSIEDLKSAKEQNDNGKKYYLVPTVGINIYEAESIWDGKIPKNAKKSQQKYWLIDFSGFGYGEAISSYDELNESSVNSANQKILSLIETLEIITTIRILRQVDLSPQLSTFFVSNELTTENEAIAFSTYIEKNVCHVVIIIIPKDKMIMSGFVMDGTVFYLSGNDLENCQIIPTGIQTGPTKRSFVFQILKSP